MPGRVTVYPSRTVAVTTESGGRSVTMRAPSTVIL